MKPNPYKIGDRVKIIHTDYPTTDGLQVGDIGVVDAHVSRTAVLVKGYCFLNKEIEPATDPSQGFTITKQPITTPSYAYSLEGLSEAELMFIWRTLSYFTPEELQDAYTALTPRLEALEAMQAELTGKIEEVLGL